MLRLNLKDLEVPGRPGIFVNYRGNICSPTRPGITLKPQAGMDPVILAFAEKRRRLFKASEKQMSDKLQSGYIPPGVDMQSW